MPFFNDTTILGKFKATGIIKSTVKTGIAPFAIDSTTLVSNLNAELLNGQAGTYYLD